MKNMLLSSKKLYDSGVLEPHERWVRSKQVDELVAKHDKNGHEIHVPIFDVGIMSIESLGVREFGDEQNPSGTVHADLYRLNDGMSRLTQTWIPYDVQAQFTATSGMAFATMVPGYDQDRAEQLALSGIPNIQVSAEQGNKHWPGFGDIARLGQTALCSPEISIAKSSQAETEIIADLINNRYNLPQLIEAHGDSRGSMTSLGRAVYSGLKQADGTSLYDLTPLWVDPKAIVLHDRLPAEKFYKVIKWLAKEALVGSQVMAELAMQKKLLSLRGTVSLNPNFLLASAIGTAPALLAGETGELVSMLPDDMRGFANGYVRDELFDQENWEEGLQSYPNLYLNLVDKAVHAHLLSIRGLQRQMGRFDRLAEESRTHGTNVAAYDVPYVAGRMPEQFSLQKSGTALAA